MYRTDYISPRLTEMMIQYGQKACFMKDRKEFLPAHVACSRHCSPEKLQMLLRVNPEALRCTTYDGSTLLSLATTTATKSHPNYALIDELRRQLEEAGLNNEFPVRVSSDDTNEDDDKKVATTTTTTKRRSRKRKVTADDGDDPANLLLHFSRHTGDKKIKLFAKV
jgi:hypothetical protein